MMRMTFGKYAGIPLSEVPEGYLVWVLDNLDKLSPTLRSAIRIRLGLEAVAKTAQEVKDPFENLFARQNQERKELDKKLRAWFRQLALDYHPDCRGSDDAMLALNDANERLRKMLLL
jgi:hypothetical protein